MKVKVFLTGSFGSTGEFLLIELLRQGYEVFCFDLKSKATLKKQRRLIKKYSFETIWGDLRQCEVLEQELRRIQPDRIIHNAAIIPPLAYLNPVLSYAVNYLGTKNLLEVAELLESKPKFVFISSYSVFGPQNPYKELKLIDAETKPNPGDNYGKQKQEGEQLVSNSKLDWNIIRFPAVFGLDVKSKNHPDILKFNFMLSPDRREHGIDVRDAALAVVNSLKPTIVNKTFTIAGDDTWKKTGGEFFEALIKVRGMEPLPKEAFRKSNPKIDRSWYYETWVDTKESQELLEYQTHNFEEYLRDLSARLGFQKKIFSMMKSVIKKKMLKDSPYYGKAEEIDDQPFWEAFCKQFGVEIDNEIK